ncbi:YukJ family protein [Bacillus sp. FSL R9-9410]|uniref:YukJ family protein n=1 Tax=Bacillus sp. FSL R9-9410 TaxID=2921590 RepID=UPI003100B432
MPVENYGVLKGIPAGLRVGRDLSDRTPHFKMQIKIAEENEERQDYEIVINVKSKSEESSDLLYLADPNFEGAQHITHLQGLSNGYHRINNNNREIALDYIRGNLEFNPAEMVPLPFHETGLDNDLNDFLFKHTVQAIEQEATVYIYGSEFDDENGMHNVHMNQGSTGEFRGANGIYQDGGILIQFSDHWVAIFLAFAVQSWCTDDDGHPTEQCTHLQVER